MKRKSDGFVVCNLKVHGKSASAMVEGIIAASGFRQHCMVRSWTPGPTCTGSTERFNPWAIDDGENLRRGRSFI